RTAPSRSNPFEGHAHRRHVNPHAGFPQEGHDEHLTRPSRTPPAVLLRRGPHHLVEQGQIPLVQFPFAVFFPVVHQTRFPLLAEPSGHFINRRSSHVQNLRRLRGAATV